MKILKMKTRIIKRRSVTWFRDSLDAWERINENLVIEDPRLKVKKVGRISYLFDFVIGIRKAELPPDIDFGKYFHYYPQKWKHLITNYVDLVELDKVKSTIEELEAKKRPIYNIAFQFKNDHQNGKNCLLTAIFSKKGTRKLRVTLFLRATEATKRLLVDLLLFQRLGEYIWGGRPFSMILYCNQLIQDDSVLLMYHVHKDLGPIIDQCKDEKRRDFLTVNLYKLMKTPLESIKYKVYRRVAKVLREGKKPILLAKDCQLTTKSSNKKLISNITKTK